MTRYARSGSTQKHKKMPGDSTPWSQLSSNGPKSLPQNSMNKKGKNNVKNSSVLKDKRKLKRYFHTKLADVGEEEKSSFQQAVENKEIKQESTFSEQESTFPEKESTFPEKESTICISDMSENTEMKQEVFSKETVLIKNKNKNKKFKGNKNKNKIANQVAKNEAELPEIAKSPNKYSKEDRKKYFMDKLKKRRAENGITLLPSKRERKLYNIRRKLKDKGIPPAVIKEIMRKERRKEELQFRKTFDPSKPCYNCRKLGHFLADCPEKVKSSKQATGICFKCGSSSHTSFKCPDKIQGFPFAKCFICKEQGHISRDCPSNTHGVYIKGGRCNLCGNVNHLKKDCPSLMKKKTKEEEESFTLPTLNEATSIDEEITERKHPFKKNANAKKPKYVKF